MLTKKTPKLPTSLSRLAPLKSLVARYAKPLALLCGFGLCLIRILALVGGPHNGSEVALDASWLMSLPTTLAQNEWLGRDIYFTYGPLAQLLGGLGNAFNVTGSAFDGYAFILLVFRLTGLLSFCLALGLVKQIDWKLTLAIFFLANLFNIVIFTEYNRSWALVVNALLMARLLSARSSRGQVIGAGLLGLLAVLLGLYTTDLGLYSLLAGGVVLVGFSGLARWRPQVTDLGSARHYLILLGTFVGAYLAGSLIVSLVFKLTSVNYEGLFDYQLFSLEIVRAYNYTQGSSWGFLWTATLVLGCVIIYVVWYVATHAFQTTPENRFLLLSLLVYALVTLKSTTVRSDASHIVLATTPLMFLFLLLGSNQWQLQPAVSSIRLGWAALVVGLVITWPVVSLQPFGDLNWTISGHVPVLTRLSEAHQQNTPPQQIAPADLIAAIRPDADLLAFPYDNYLAIGLRHRMVAPVLQSYSAGTPRLQAAYVKQVERRKSNLEIIYGLDGLGVDPVDQVQDVTRLPRVFEEFYRNFELKTPAVLGKGFVVLKPRLQPPANGDLRSTNLTFTAVPGPNNLSTISLATPASCSLIRLTSKLSYPVTALIGRPARPGLKFSDGSNLLLDTGLISLEPGQFTATYVQLLDSTDFPKIFGSEPVPTKRWDKLQVVIRSTGFLDVGPSSFEVNKIECLTFAR